jgi:hypothetical protein
VTTTVTPRRLPQAGPPLPPVAIAAVALFLASLIVPIALSGGTVYPSPFSSQATIVDYFRDNRVPVLLTALLQFAAAPPLVIYTATASVRLNQLGIRAPGTAIALAGGVLASAAMALSAMFTWTLTRPELLDHAELIRLLHDLAFIAGGPGFVVPSGLLVAGIAVPGLLASLLPRWLAWSGLVLAALAFVATLTVALPALAPLLPIVRFPSLAWIIFVAFRLPRRRLPANAADAS